MPKHTKIIITLALIIALSPILLDGFPDVIENIFFVCAGLTIVALSYLSYKFKKEHKAPLSTKDEEASAQTFEENKADFEE